MVFFGRYLISQNQIQTYTKMHQFLIYSGGGGGGIAPNPSAKRTCGCRIIILI